MFGVRRLKSSLGDSGGCRLVRVLLHPLLGLLVLVFRLLLLHLVLMLHVIVVLLCLLLGGLLACMRNRRREQSEAQKDEQRERSQSFQSFTAKLALAAFYSESSGFVTGKNVTKVQ